MRDRDANDWARRSYSESTTSRQTVPAKKVLRLLSVAGKIAIDERESNSLLLFRLEAGQFFDQRVTVGAIAPPERSDGGSKRAGHRIELLAVGHVDYVGWSIGEKLRLVGLQHRVERRIKHQLGDAGFGLPCFRGRILGLGAHHNPDRVAAGLGDFELTRFDQACLVLADFLDA